MSPWESIHLLWFEALDICFIPTLHIEQYGELLQEGQDGLTPCNQIGAVRYFKCFKVDSDLPLHIGKNIFELDKSFSPEIERTNQQLHIGAKAGVQVHLFRSFDVPNLGAQFTGRSFKSTGGSTAIQIDQFAFKSIRRGAHFVGVNLQDENRIGPIGSLWVEGKSPTVTVSMSGHGQVVLEIEQSSSHPSIDLQVRLERRRDEYPIHEFSISVSSVMTPFVFADTQALMHNDRIQFIPPKGFGIELITPSGRVESNIIEYNSVNSHQAAFRAVDQLWRTSVEWTQAPPIPNPEGVSPEIWDAFADRFPVLSDQVSILTHKGIDLEQGLSTLYPLPNILIQLLLQQSGKALAHQLKELAQ